MQKDYELYLRDQFQTADKTGTGSLSKADFARLLQQLNIHLTETEILAIFDGSNTNRTAIGGEQVEAILNEN